MELDYRDKVDRLKSLNRRLFELDDGLGSNPLNQKSARADYGSGHNPPGAVFSEEDSRCPGGDPVDRRQREKEEPGGSRVVLAHKMLSDGVFRLKEYCCEAAGDKN